MNAKEFYEKWGFWPIAGGAPDGPPVGEGEIPPVVEPPVEPPPSEEPPVVTPPPSPVVSLETKLDGDQVPEELRGKSLNEVIDMLRKPATPPPADEPPPSNESNQEEQIAALRSEFYQDPIGTTMKLVQMSVAPIIENIYVDKAEKARGGIKTNKDYELIEKDIDEFMANVPPNLRANPQTWDIAYNYAKGKNFDKLASRGQTPPPPADLPAGTSGGGNLKGVQLSAEEKVAAEKLGISEEEYAKWR